MDGWDDGYWPPYVSVAEKRKKAEQNATKLKKKGKSLSPVKIEGRKITTTFWGNAWCANLEAYSDFSNRLPRGRTYVRNGSVIDLQIENGEIKARVSGTRLYTINIKIKPLPDKKWNEIKTKCSGQIESLIELLQGSLSKSVMEIVTRKGDGLFPSPQEIDMNCSCPDWATMCKHVAAALYGVGSRLDLEPELLFKLRGVDAAEMIQAAIDQPVSATQKRKGRVLKADDLSSIFGVDINMEGTSPIAPSPIKSRRKQSTTKIQKSAGNNANIENPTKPSTGVTAVETKKNGNRSRTKKEVEKKTTDKKPAAKKEVENKATDKKPATKKEVKKKTTNKKPAAKKDE
ncbi:hypothetical protein KKF34_11055 [Myxococcota bacterium]|nr:hypothetical protein [Myxococcota bacterium]MBU1382046.1 hypothetical protein [Myxococcota bacterium]MBU1497403.1 hypothetical protein [Myxococcota bacterium]